MKPTLEPQSIYTKNLKCQHSLLCFGVSQSPILFRVASLITFACETTFKPPPLSDVPSCQKTP